MNEPSLPPVIVGLQGRKKNRTESKKFRLVRYFALTSLLGVLLVLAPLLYFYRDFATEALEQHETADNVAITRIFASTLWPQHAAYVTTAGKLSKEELRTNPKVAQIRADVLRQMKGLSVVKVKIYDLHGMTIFSTEMCAVLRMVLRRSCVIGRGGSWPVSSAAMAPPSKIPIQIGTRRGPPTSSTTTMQRSTTWAREKIFASLRFGISFLAITLFFPELTLTRYKNQH